MEHIMANDNLLVYVVIAENTLTLGRGEMILPAGRLKSNLLAWLD